jgi:predicted DNA-binding transcriptional regulator YafY
VTSEELRCWSKGMQDPDHWVLRLTYQDAKGAKTNRIVSPIRFVGSDKVLALCLAREEPRLLKLDKCSSLVLVKAETVLMPVALTELGQCEKP